MAGNKGIATPNKCPICGAPYGPGARGFTKTDPGTIQTFYECGGIVKLYPFPDGWRMDIYRCGKPTQEKTRPTQKPQRWLFTDQEGGI